MNYYSSIDRPLKNKQPQKFLKNKRILILQTILTCLEHINIFVKKGMEGNFSEEYWFNSMQSEKYKCSLILQLEILPLL